MTANRPTLQDWFDVTIGYAVLRVMHAHAQIAFRVHLAAQAWARYAANRTAERCVEMRARTAERRANAVRETGEPQPMNRLDTIPAWETYSAAQRESIKIALARPLSEDQRATYNACASLPPAESFDSTTLAGAYWRGRAGKVNIHAPGCDAFAAWRAGFDTYRTEGAPV